MKIFGSVEMDKAPWVTVVQGGREEFFKELNGLKLQICVSPKGDVRFNSRQINRRIVFGLNAEDQEDDQNTGYMISYDLIPGGEESPCKFDFEHDDLLRPLMKDEFMGIPQKVVKFLERPVLILHHKFN